MGSAGLRLCLDHVDRSELTNHGSLAGELWWGMDSLGEDRELGRCFYVYAHLPRGYMASGKIHGRVEWGLPRENGVHS
jgi:hypothetical protein